MAPLSRFELYEEIDLVEKYAPKRLMIVFDLIHRCRRLLKRDLESDEGPATNQAFNQATKDYERFLRKQAVELHMSCNAPASSSRSEGQWVSAMLPYVFQCLHHEFEESGGSSLSQFFCLACRKNFVDGSRLYLNPVLAQAEERRRASLPGPALLEPTVNAELEYCSYHLNIPSFSLRQWLQHSECKGGTPRKGQGRRTGKIPDATLGLQMFNVESGSLEERHDLIQDPLVALFDEYSIRNLLKDITCPYDFDTKEGIPMFAWALYEGKKSTQSLKQALDQSLSEITKLLDWQREIIRRAGFKTTDIIPTVWFFSSVGSEWFVYGFFESARRYRGVKLWSGNAADSNQAVQTIYIANIIKVWGEHTHKPAMAACLQSLDAEAKGLERPRIEDTLWAKTIDINEVSTPFFFSRPSLDFPEPAPPSSQSRSSSAPPSTTRTPPRPPIPHMRNTTDSSSGLHSKTKRRSSRRGLHDQPEPSDHGNTDDSLHNSFANLEVVQESKSTPVGKRKSLKQGPESPIAVGNIKNPVRAKQKQPVSKSRLSGSCIHDPIELSDGESLPGSASEQKPAPICNKTKATLRRK